jgi:hypothetical protein
MKENKRTWVIVSLALSLVIPGITATINYLMDPLWCFSVSNRYNQIQDDFNERQQKTNYVTYHEFDKDALIIGSSTSTSLNQHHYRGLRAYNYAINGLHPDEYLPYIMYAKERNGRDFQYIFMGMDFMLTTVLPPPSIDAAGVIADAQSPLYRIKTLLSLSTLQYSRRNFLNYLHGKHIYYDRNNVKYSTILSRKDLEHNMVSAMKVFEDSEKPYAFKNHYRYNDGYRRILETIRDKNPKSKIVVYTVPVIDPYYVMMVRYNHIPEYERWIREIVDVYGECYNFYFPSWLTREYMKYFHDPNHFYPFVADMLVDAMYNGKDSEASGICIRITKDNIDQKLALIRQMFVTLAAGK